MAGEAASWASRVNCTGTLTPPVAGLGDRFSRVGVVACTFSSQGLRPAADTRM